MTLFVTSYGGGIQSTALLVLAAQGKINYTTFLFANVGEDSENPATIEYVRAIAVPYAQSHGIEVIEVARVKQDGTRETLYGRITRPGSKSIGIPVRMSNGAPAMRACTSDFKIQVIDKWLREHGAKKEGAVVALGISLDEFQRARNDSGLPWKKLVYPLLDMRLDRQDCTNIIRDAGLLIPPKSSCWFCPYHSLRTWQTMRQEEPELFWKANDLEHFINMRRRTHGQDSVWFTDKGKSLEQVTTDLVQNDLFSSEDDMCESGYCFM